MRDIIMSSILTALFVLVASFLYNEVDAKVYCAPEKIEDIQALTISDRLPQMMPTLRPDYSAIAKDKYDKPMCVIEMQMVEGEEVEVITNEPCCMGKACNVESYYYDQPVDENDLRTLYERLVIDSKPTEAEFQAVLDSWKADKISDINFENGVCDLQSDFRQLAKKCGYERANITKLMHEMIDSKDLVKRDCLVSKQSEVQTEKDRSARISAKKQRGAAAKGLAQDVIDLIAGYNVDRALTEEQIDSMEATFAPTLNALSKGRPKKAKKKIQLIVPDGTLVTQEMKDDALHLLKDL